MKILFVRTTPNEVDLSSYNLQEVGLAKALVRKGHECDVMYYTSEADHTQTVTFDGDKTINIHWLHGYGVFYEGYYPSLKKYVKDYDIIQVGGYVGITSWWLNSHVQDKVVNYQGPYFCPENKGDIRKAKIWDKTLLPLSNKKNMIVATKSALATEYIKSKGIDNVTTIGVGLDLDNILSSAEDMYEHELVKQLQTQKGDSKYLLYIGALEERRNIHFLLRTFARTAERMPECKLVLIGRGKKEYVDSCHALIDELGIQNKVICRERVEQKYLKAVYELCDAFLLPTRYEIFGMVLLEAMYFGLPVFTTYNGGSSTLMTADNGVVIEQLDEQRWANAICDVLDNAEKAASIGRNAAKTISENYTWDALADKFLAVYESRVALRK